MKQRLSGYSLLEIILVTTFIIIFIVVINPGTYIDRFSKILLKMNVLNESELLVNKLNSFAYKQCSPQSMGGANFTFSTNQGLFSLQFDSDQLLIMNLNSSSSAVLYRHLDPLQPKEFDYSTVFFTPPASVSDVFFIDLSFHSSLLDYAVMGSIVCNDHQIVLGAF